jgi:hypothetical protein
MEKFEQEIFMTVSEGVEKLNEYVEKGLIINNLNIIPNNNVGYTFVYSVRQKFEKKENNRDKNDEKNFNDRKPGYKKEYNESKPERNIKPNMEKMLKDVLGNDGLDNADYNNRRTEKNRRKNNYENKKKYK